jgi:hypothetical protein
MEVVPWNNLRIGKKYFVVTNSDISNDKMPVVIRSLTFMNQGEAMIHTLGGYSAYAVGGMFEGPGGPKNVFLTDPTEDYSGPSADPAPAPAAVPEPAPAAVPKPPPALNLSGIQMSDDDWAMAYGLRRCRICDYNEGPEICPNNCYAVKKDE